MPKTKISEFDSTPANNTDIDGINIAEGCAPSGINNAIRELMSQLKDQQTGASGDGFAVAGTLAVTGGLTLDGSAGTTGQVLLSAGTGNTPTWGASFSGMIVLWSGSIATIPTGWVLCDGTNSTPNLRDRFIVGAGSGYAVGATGGSANATLVSHSHSFSGSTGAMSANNTHRHTTTGQTLFPSGSGGVAGGTASETGNADTGTVDINHVHSFSGSTSTEGSSATNANLPPYYALAYIMKT
jgi:microcystin-dependent protein